MTSPNPYSVKNIKSFRGREGVGFNATLYRDGKKIGLVMDSANGGPFRYELDGSGEYQKLVAYAKTRYDGIEPEDSLLASMVDEAEFVQKSKARLKREFPKKTFIAVTGENTIRLYNKPFTPSMAAAIRDVYKGGVTILNELSFDDAVNLYLERLREAA